MDSKREYYLSGDRRDEAELKELFTLLDDPGLEGEERFAVVQTISDAYLRNKDYGRLIAFLSGVVERDAADPYAAHYLFTVAFAYTQMGAKDVAALYFDRIVKNHPDLILKGESIHKACLERLLELTDSPTRRIDYRRELIARFSDSIDLGAAWFLLGKEYERIGTGIPPWRPTRNIFRTSALPSGISGRVPICADPDRVRELPQGLDVRKVGRSGGQGAGRPDPGEPAHPQRLRAKVGFFAMSWQQDQMEGNSQVLFDFSEFMTGSRIYSAPALDPSSNAREAFLRTWGWSERIATWYLYFRKINFPADPEIHGRWEWAGIYFGEKLN